MFFDPPPEPERPSRETYRPPPWVSRPRGVLLSGVPIVLVLARTEQVAVALGRFGACEDGFEAELSIFGRGESDDADDGMLPPFGPRRRRNPDPAEGLRFGVRYADGGKAQLDQPWGARSSEPPAGPVICQGGGGGGAGEWHHSLWFWPLPPAGAVTFALEWRERGIELSMHELDAAPIRDAAGTAQRIFPEDEMPDTPGFTSGTMHVSAPGPSSD